MHSHVPIDTSSVQTEIYRFHRICKGCGCEFWARSDQAAWHSAACKQRAYRARKLASAGQITPAEKSADQS